MGQLNYSTSKIQALLDKVNEVFHRGPIWNSSGASYSVFARIQKNTAAAVSLASFLVSGVAASTIKKRGLYWVEVLNRSTGFNLVATQLVAPTSGTVTFGYYLEGDYYYIGVYRTGGYGGGPSTVLMSTSTNLPIEFGEFYNSATQPTGWTTAES